MLKFIEHTQATFDLMGADDALQEAKTVWKQIQWNQLSQFFQRECFNVLRANFSKIDKLKIALQFEVAQLYPDS